MIAAGSRPPSGGIDSEAHVWLVPVPEDGPSPWVLLSVDERARASRFRLERDRRSYITAHALVRRALSVRAPGVPPSSWTFRTGEHGRPEVDGPRTATAVRFNLSHTEGLVACVVTGGADCGVDVERSDRATEVDVLGRWCLTPAEQEELARVPGSVRTDWFVRRWTLKEAYAKARGLGLALAFDSFGFSTGVDGSVVLVDGTDGECWRLVQRRVSGAHTAAVAVRRDRGCELRVRWHWGMPGGDPATPVPAVCREGRP